VASIIGLDVMAREEPAKSLRQRASTMLAGTDEAQWQNREGAARALNIAATVLAM
jgi:hypothetical protein